MSQPDAALFVIGMVMKDLLSILSRADHQHAELATGSRLALTAIQNAAQ
jgi:hypothetical protein